MRSFHQKDHEKPATIPCVSLQYWPGSSPICWGLVSLGRRESLPQVQQNRGVGSSRQVVHNTTDRAMSVWASSPDNNRGSPGDRKPTILKNGLVCPVSVRKLIRKARSRFPSVGEGVGRGCGDAASIKLACVTTAGGSQTPAKDIAPSTLLVVIDQCFWTVEAGLNLGGAGQDRWNKTARTHRSR